MISSLALLSDLAAAVTPSPQPGPHTTASSNAALTVAQFCTTAVIGVAGFFLARIQVKNTQFKPDAIAIAQRGDIDGSIMKIAVRVSNDGGAPGMIRRIDVRHGPDFSLRRISGYTGWGLDSPLPFYLPGRASAEIVIEPPEGGAPFRETDRIVLEYGLAKKVTVEVLAYSYIGSVTILPPGSAPVSAPRLRKKEIGLRVHCGLLWGDSRKVEGAGYLIARSCHYSPWLPSRLPSTHTYVERARALASRWSAPLYERPGRQGPCLLGLSWIDGRRDGSSPPQHPTAGTRPRSPRHPGAGAPPPEASF